MGLVRIVRILEGLVLRQLVFWRLAADPADFCGSTADVLVGVQNVVRLCLMAFLVREGLAEA